ncbi:hypothetical protein ACH95_15515 [Bacillus glycinifermentans]|uniref:hypothetical protein n=1 Tax=Bacillus glycinifermentans TaxID=1664069 RepID=UPI0006537CCE|nr:hypothetical protein [Bacillus glycinifermentans]KMM57579.1 hypothetical protein ACH95_15515 [Bacillus glycinifermentans]MEC0496604.1 hypothetical protein [Bacillus glycinifermentans]MEC0542400.1 hypothetical protein [Bacillus glycinifermentans]
MTKTKKYVRIKKSSNPAYWYADRIGEVFEVEGMDDTDYAVFIEDIGSSLVLKKDAELIVTEKRPAKKGEKVLVIDPPELNTYILPYEKAEVVGTFSNSPIERDYSGVFVRVVLGKRPEYLSDEQYEVIINNEVKNEEADGMKIDLDAMGYDELIAHGEAVMRAIRLRSYGEGYKQGKFDAEMDTTYMRPQEKSAQERRDEIVEQAKADIANLNYRTFGELRYSYRSIVCNVEFVINKKKRTVVALLKSVGRGTVESKGIAKAAPDDCFNEHIGKAIALHRALGLEVPDEYLNAPQPTEVRVGDVICTPHGSMHKVNKRHINEISDSYLSRCKIIDDSRTETI